MSQILLSKDYRAIFVDDPKYSGRVSTHLAGLASAIEDSHQNWKPTVSELVALLPKSDESNALVAAGMAYGAAKQMMADYPGPAILLFGAALNAIGTAPYTELQWVIEQAEAILKANGLDSREEIRKTVQAAKERASFDKVSQMLRDEFTLGLKDSGKYTETKIEEVVPKIVKVTHDVRHRGLIERLRWKNLVVEEGGSSTNIGYFHEIDEVIFTDDLLQELLEYAQVGCAFSILRRFENRRINCKATTLS
jgi:hypothetical protein